MAGVRDIKRRIRAIQNTKKITKAMEMVAAARLHRAEMRARGSKPYSDRLRAIVARLSGLLLPEGIEPEEYPLLAGRRLSGRSVVAVITADRGLCGSYNANVIRLAQRCLEEAGAEAGVVAIGKKGYDFFRHRGVPIMGHFTRLGEEARHALAVEVAETLMGLFMGGEAREVQLVYTEFFSALSLRPTAITLLPLLPPPGEERPAVAPIFVPDARAVFSELLPRLVTDQVYHALIEAKASEHAARMTAMRSATENAAELIEELTLEFNRARQTAITTEIVEVVSGAEALKG